MKDITTIQDANCVQGTLKSILSDSDSANLQKQEIFKNISERTEGNVTFIEPSEIENFLEPSFKNFKLSIVKELKDFEVIDKIDNENNFGILFWNGDDNGNNRHATRLINNVNNLIELMNPQNGMVEKWKFNDLLEYSPTGFTLVTMQKKSL